MIHVLLPDDALRPLPFYLAMEEYLAARGNDDYFFMWQVEPTVIIGRNQHILTEVNLEYCNRRGINVVRRKSGGGCVYADMNNVMFSYVTTSDAVVTTFSAYTAMVADMLCQLGVEAEAGGRNDILIHGRKVSGNAFYHKRGRAILHGTMLYNTDISEMLHAITPSTQKLTSKGVESVRSRVINLNEVLDLTLDEFKRRSASVLCDSELYLTAEDVEAIDRIAENYYSRQWQYGNSPRAMAGTTRRIEGVGEFDVSVSLKSDKIEHVDIKGDFFLLSDIDTMLLDRLKGVDYNRDAVVSALSGVDVSTVIASLDTKEFINLIIP